MDSVRDSLQSQVPTDCCVHDGGSYLLTLFTRTIHRGGHEDGLSRSMTISPNSTLMKERIWINRVASEIVFQPLHPDIGAPLHPERVIAVREEPNLHLEVCRRGVTDRMRSPWKLPLDVFPNNFQILITVAKKFVIEVQPVIGWDFLSSATEVDHEALLLASVNEVRQPGIHAPNCSLTDGDGYLEGFSPR